ncbi:MAG: NAD-dependent epimerase/dehydratase family protein [Oligoflexus sp.]
MNVAVVIGASGLVGKQLLLALSENPRYDKIICLDRRPITSPLSKITRKIIDFDHLIDVDLGLDSTALADGFCCLGTTHKKAGSRKNFFQVDHDYVVQFAQLMWRYQTHHLAIVSSLGASAKTLSHYSRTKGLMEEAVRGLGLVSVSFLRPSLLLGPREESRPLEDWFKPASKLIPSARFRGIEASDVAKAMMALAEEAKPGYQIYPSEIIRHIAEAY